MLFFPETNVPTGNAVSAVIITGVPPATGPRVGEADTFFGGVKTLNGKREKILKKESFIACFAFLSHKKLKKNFKTKRKRKNRERKKRQRKEEKTERKTT